MFFAQLWVFKKIKNNNSGSLYTKTLKNYIIQTVLFNKLTSVTLKKFDLPMYFPNFSSGFLTLWPNTRFLAHWLSGFLVLIVLCSGLRSTFSGCALRGTVDCSD